MSSRFLRALSVVGLIALPVVAAGVALLWYVLEQVGRPPRVLAPYIERRASGHNPVIVESGRWTARRLMALDRGNDLPGLPPSLRVGAQPEMTAASGENPPGRNVVVVASAGDAKAAIEKANPGDTITFLPGTYRFSGANIRVNRPGSRGNEITVRASRPGTVFLEFAISEGFWVMAPHWKFENLNIRGVCARHSTCEHAFHVVGKGAYFTARNNTVVDFNAHFKVNAAGADAPDHGLIENNTISNSSVRATGNPVTPVDLVAASHWIVRGNLISDFVKGDGDLISYGAFAKGGGSDNLFERNVVLCEARLRGAPGRRVGLSLGGGGSGASSCRGGKCVTEQDASTIQANLIAFCSDDGIYLNRAASSRILHNTLIDTGGMVARFFESTADARGNLVDGAIRVRDGALLRASDNRETSLIRLYLGLHPVRELYVDAASLNLAWRSQAISRASAAGIPDLCAATRPPAPAYGAFEDFSACLR